jgi:DNA-binding SARP family transcriptional activator
MRAGVRLRRVYDYRILGSLEAFEGDRPVALGGARCRAVLAVLVVCANRPVSAGRLVDEVWGDPAPPTAANVVQGHISDLRRALGRDAIETRGDAYVLHVPHGGRDVDRFEGHAARGSEELRDGRYDEASAAFAEALALWRGTALSDIAEGGLLVAEALRLDEMRLHALEQRIEADLACGRHAELVGELRALVAEHRLREPLRAHLAMALYRSGRQVEALEVLREARRSLADELGLEPSPRLQELERAILQHDPAVGEPPRPGPVVALASPQRSIMLAQLGEAGFDGLIELAAPLAANSGRELLVTALVDDPGRLAEASRSLNRRRETLLRDGVAARSVSFISADAEADIVRLAQQQDTDLLLVEALPAVLGDARLGTILAEAPCDVGILVGLPGEGPVLVAFSGAEHDWAAIELGAWLAMARGTGLVLAGSTGDASGRDASRLLASASLAIQRTVGVAAEPLLVDPDPSALVAATAGMGLLVVGLSRRWQQEGLGPARSALVARENGATLLVRRGLRPGGLAPAGHETRFTWTIQPLAT